MNREKTCAGCGATFTGNCKVIGGERYCRTCEPLEVGLGKQSPDFEDPQTIAEYEASKAAVVGVGELMGEEAQVR